jgi:hypothetical protein
MRGCVTLFLFLVLAAACGYSIWQIRLLRQDVDQLQAHVLVGERVSRESMLEHAQAALRALGRGELEVAEEELDRVAELIEETRTLAADERDRLTRRLAAARKAIADGSATAVDFLQDLIQDLSDLRGGESPEGDAETDSEP